MTELINGHEEYGVSAHAEAESSAERDSRGPFVSRRRRLRNRWNVRMVKGERAQQLEQKQGGSGQTR